MNLNNLLSILTNTPESGILPGEATYDFGGAAITALVSILIVFACLIVIIFITHFLFLGLNKISQAIEKSDSKFAKFLKKGKKPAKVASNPTQNKVEILDDDMMAAVLAATIDYQSEVKSDVRLVSVKEIK